MTKHVNDLIRKSIDVPREKLIIEYVIENEKLEKRIEELEKENKELRIRNTNAVLNMLEMKVLKDSHRDRANKTQEQLTKAKEIIGQFLNDYPVITKELLDKLEQFIKEM